MGILGCTLFNVCVVIWACLVFVLPSLIGEGQTETAKKTPCPIHNNSGNSRSYLLVSTLDGRVSALDMRKSGELKWSVSTGETPLISSSISKLELKRNGVITHLIPSLDGGLYQFDGESIQAVPITAESLLKSSFKVNEDSVIVGSKESKTMGINMQDGATNYECGPSGCEVYEDESVTSNKDVIIIKKDTQTVRAVDMRSGGEKWNFSVSLHEITFLEGLTPAITDDDGDDDVTIATCPGNDDPVLETVEVDLQVVVPHGSVAAVSQTDRSEIIWQQKFEYPIAGAWLLNGNDLKRVSLFDSNTVPALESNGFTKAPKPMLYLGIHNNQMYVQPSVKMAEHVLIASDRMAHPQGIVALPRVQWKPYISSAPSRTPHMNVRRSSPLIGDEDHPTKCALKVWQEMDYPYDNGYYLFADKTPVPVKQLLENHNYYSWASVLKAIWQWWREVAVSTTAAAFLIHIFIRKYVRSWLHIRHISEVKFFSISDSTPNCYEDLKQVTKSSEFVSRYYTDFEESHCLGKGGFGQVFEAKNKLDDCRYAIKRIPLTNSEEAKEHVMREVKALAKLDHPGIVRYFQAWFESPPPGWQEEIDKDSMDSEGLVPTPCNSVAEFKPAAISSESEILASRGFTPHLKDINDESGSFTNYGSLPKTTFELSESDGIVFEHNSTSDHETEPCSNVRIPFQNYARKARSEGEGQRSRDPSISVVFEDSGKGSRSESQNADGDSRGDSSLDPLKDLHVQSLESRSTTSSISSKGDSPTTPATSTLESSPRSKHKTEHKNKLYLYIQMQLCKRESLKEWLNANTLTRNQGQLWDIFEQITVAMEFVHELGLMHRDLKPSNIFFSMDGYIKIGDFGLVTAMADQLDEARDETDLTLKKHTDKVGTQLYMSPEQIEGRSYCHKVDVYSMGLIFLELFYPCSTQMERIQTILNARKLLFPGRFNKELPEECQFVKWLLTPNTDVRPSIKDVLNSDLMKRTRPEDHLTHHKRNRSRTISSSSS